MKKKGAQLSIGIKRKKRILVLVDPKSRSSRLNYLTRNFIARYFFLDYCRLQFSDNICEMYKTVKVSLICKLLQEWDEEMFVFACISAQYRN